MKKQLHLAIAVAVLLFATFQSQRVSADDGTGVVTVTANGSSCIAFTPANGNGPDNWEVAEGGSYTMTITGVTECSGDAITVFIQSSNSGNFCFNAIGGSGTYAGTFTVPNPTCHTMPISYKCGADQSCDNANTFNANGPSGNHKIHLRSSIFNGDCVKMETDEDCEGNVCTLGLSGDIHDIACHGAENGSIAVTVSGAQGSVTYEWNDGVTTEDRTGLSGGTYTVTATDGEGCTASESFTINEQDALVVNGDITNVSINGGNDGSVDVSVTGGTAPYSYLWNDGETSEDRSGLTTGTYTVTVTDKNECPSEQSFTITEPECICEAPSNYTIDSVSAAEALLCWDQVNCASVYIIAWRTQPKTAWIYSTVTAPEHCLLFTNDYNDVYDIQVATVCQNGDTSEYSQIFTFQTFASCLTPQNPYTDGITPVKATLHWSGITDATKYQVKYRKTGESGWNKKNLNASKISYTLNSLLPSSSYEWKVQSRCTGTTRSVGGDFTSVQHFTTSALRMDLLTEAIPAFVSIYPNPASDQMVIAIEAGDNTTKTMMVEIVNLLGQVIYSTPPQAISGSLKKEIDLSGITGGMYTTRVTLDGKEFFSQLLIQH